MKTYWLKFSLLSDATFGRGDGVAGMLDIEVQHDQYGLPFLGGKTLKGLLMAESAEIIDALQAAGSSALAPVLESAQRLFGDPGSQHEQGDLHVGDACLPADLRSAIADEFANRCQSILTSKARKREWGLLQKQYLESLTAIRRQTAMDVDGAPLTETLRSLRVIIRQTPFEARLDFLSPPERFDEALLGACVRAFRRAGTGRHRGRGRLRADLYLPDRSTPVTDSLLSQFKKVVTA